MINKEDTPTMLFEDGEWRAGPNYFVNTAGDGAVNSPGLLVFASASVTATVSDLVVAFAHFCSAEVAMVCVASILTEPIHPFTLRWSRFGVGAGSMTMPSSPNCHAYTTLQPSSCVV